MQYDFIVIGAGVIGCSTAYYLQKNSPKSKILLIDQWEKIAKGNTAKSAALYRNLFSSKTSQLLASSSIAFYQTIADKIGLKNYGYFWMFSEKDWEKAKNGLSSLDEERDNLEILTTKQISNNLKLNTKKLGHFQEVHRVLFGHRCGAISARKLASFYVEGFQKMGGELTLNTNIAQIALSEKENNYPPWKSIEILSLKDQKGNKYTAKEFLFATGAWTHKLLTPLGLAPHIYPKKRQLFVLKLKDTSQMVIDPEEKIPILILPTGGVYIKPILQNKMIMIGCADDLGNPFQMTEDFPPSAQESFFTNVIEPVLQHYFPNLRDYELFSYWAGYYAYYWPDKNPVIEKISNIQWISGTSGSGIMKADAIGRLAAGKALGLQEVQLFDGRVMNPEDLSLKKRRVDMERLII
jgi:glycine/D-amino acid oxidase-like deaminating enzyme